MSFCPCTFRLCSSTGASSTAVSDSLSAAPSMPDHFLTKIHGCMDSPALPLLLFRSLAFPHYGYSFPTSLGYTTPTETNSSPTSPKNDSSNPVIMSHRPRHASLVETIPHRLSCRMSDAFADGVASFASWCFKPASPGWQRTIEYQPQPWPPSACDLAIASPIPIYQRQRHLYPNNCRQAITLQTHHRLLFTQPRILHIRQFH